MLLLIEGGQEFVSSHDVEEALQEAGFETASFVQHMSSSGASSSSHNPWAITPYEPTLNLAKTPQLSRPAIADFFLGGPIATNWRQPQAIPRPLPKPEPIPKRIGRPPGIPSAAPAVPIRGSTAKTPGTTSKAQGTTSKAPHGTTSKASPPTTS